MERVEFKGIPGEPAREDARDKDDLFRQEREGSRGLVGLSQAVWSQRQEENSMIHWRAKWESYTFSVARLRGDRHANYRYHYRCAVRRLQHHSRSTSRAVEQLQAVSGSTTSLRQKLSRKDL